MPFLSLVIQSGLHLEKWRQGGQNNTNLGGGGAKGLQVTVHSVGGVWGHPSRKFLNFRPSEITSGIFSDHFWFLNDMR